MLYLPEATFLNISLAGSLALGGCMLVARELSPKTQLSYSKFSTPGKVKESRKVDSRLGMFIIYSPSLVASLLLLASSYTQKRNTKVLMILVVIHYLKRVYEVLFVHRYSGSMKLMDGLFISFCYFSGSPVLCYLANQVPSTFKAPSSLVAGVIIFMVGELVNHYHHVILSNLRTKTNGPKEYKIPNGGLFRFIWCPHYLGEITAFAGLTFASLNYMTSLFFVMTLGYLGVRSYYTRKWYQEKFKEIPSRYCLIPGIF